MTMQEILQKIPDWIEAIALLGMSLSILATVLVRLTPSKADDEKVDEFIKKFQKVLHWMPTIGVNPNTKKLQEAYDELKAKSEQPK
jgi:DNA polymerase I-like protein with 3'-5' exonuclease and polymerase domains